MPQRKRMDYEDDLQDFERYTVRAESGDMNALCQRLVYEDILSHPTAFTPRDRQTMCMYLLDLEQWEYGQLLGISQQGLSRRVGRCFRHMMGVITGTYQLQKQDVYRVDVPGVNVAFDKWMISVLYNDGAWWNVPISVRKFIQERFGIKGMAQERTTYNVERDGKEYPFLPDKSWYGQDRTFTGQRNERGYDDNILYAIDSDEIEESGTDYRKPNSFRRWNKVMTPMELEDEMRRQEEKRMEREQRRKRPITYKRVQVVKKGLGCLMDEK